MITQTASKEFLHAWHHETYKKIPLILWPDFSRTKFSCILQAIEPCVERRHGIKRFSLAIYMCIYACMYYVVNALLPMLKYACFSAITINVKEGEDPIMVSTYACTLYELQLCLYICLSMYMCIYAAI